MLLYIYSTPGNTGLLCSREGRRPPIDQGRRSHRVRPKSARVKDCRDVRAVEQVDCVMLRHPAQGTKRRRMICRVNMVEVGYKERGLIGSNLC